MYKVSSGTLNSVLSDSQTFALRKADFRDVTGHSVLRYGQNLHTSQQLPTTYNTNSTRARARSYYGCSPYRACARYYITPMQMPKSVGILGHVCEPMWTLDTVSLSIQL